MENKILIKLLEREKYRQEKENDKEMGECGRYEEIIIPIETVLKYYGKPTL